MKIRDIRNKCLNEFRLEQDELLMVTSDLHLGHLKEFIWKKRGFNSPEEHDEFIIQNLRDGARKYYKEHKGCKVSLLILGDIAFNDIDGERLKRVFNLGCFYKIYIIPGNHFSSFAAMDLEIPNHVRFYSNIGFLRIRTTHKVYEGNYYAFSHFAVMLDFHGFDLILHGHYHGNEEGLNPDRTYNIYGMSSCVDLGVDNALRMSHGEKCYYTMNEIQEISKNLKKLVDK